MLFNAGAFRCVHLFIRHAFVSYFPISCNIFIFFLNRIFYHLPIFFLWVRPELRFFHRCQNGAHCYWESLPRFFLPNAFSQSRGFKLQPASKPTHFVSQTCTRPSAFQCRALLPHSPMRCLCPPVPIQGIPNLWLFRWSPDCHMPCPATSKERYEPHVTFCLHKIFFSPGWWSACRKLIFIDLFPPFLFRPIYRSPAKSFLKADPIPLGGGVQPSTYLAASQQPFFIPRFPLHHLRVLKNSSSLLIVKKSIAMFKKIRDLK